MTKAATQRSERVFERGEAQDAILDAAEIAFAASGFHGATTRAIAEGAGANAALIHYYFGSKEALFEAVIARRSGAINDERRDRLAALHAAGNVTLEAVIDALLRPTITLGHDSTRGGAHFTRLLSHVASGTDERSVRITSTYYDAIARVFIDELRAVVPGLDRAAAVRGYLNAVAIGISLMAPTGRRQVLSGGVSRAEDAEDVDDTLDGAVRFIAAGIRALARPAA
ncbi:TetR/AcrR family transcriptional regulator [Pararhodobacter marinus]|uniref:TetR/AcrR family transcriptional regulator n=1 Tax=Pararhodobacter marinus TaxID=2184063 RepID=A0A2U2CB06_9RHOB|nr:TetR/AcrR family transcriptional regulator [Pararhodobacter marinus]PWE29050.1 TetR/AcrR family transcriptional regulator [Pararhodobacter marinus]